MTNKRKHQLERIVRVNFRCFNYIIYPKGFGIELLEQITKLMFDRVKLFNYTGKITLREARFMRWCISAYYGYYSIQIHKYFD